MPHKSSYPTRPVVITPIHSLVKLDRQSSIPLYRQICQCLRELILSGELAEGTRLPTERALAGDLGVNRTTVMNAYNELASEGLVERHVGRGTLVRHEHFAHHDDPFEPETTSWLLGLPAGERELLGPGARLLGEIAVAEAGQGNISFTPGSPALDFLPAEMLTTILAASLPGARKEALGYCPVEGLQSLRREIAAWMRQRGVPVDAEHILILSGSTQGVGLVGRLLLSPGDEVVVEVPTYLGAIQAFRALQVRVIGVPTDKDGMRVDLLDAILARRRPRLIYIQPTFQNPTGVVMSPERRRRLMQLSHRYQTPVLEDDPYGDVYFQDKRPLPLKAQDPHGQVIYLSTFSKILAPGLRVAWLVAPEPMIERLSLHKQIFDLNTNALGQWCVSEILRQDLLEEHLRSLRLHYRWKRDLMLEAIERYWPREVRTSHPEGGFHIWCSLPARLRARVLLRELAHEKVTFVIGEPFHADGGGQQQFRLSFAYPREQDIEEGIKRLGITMKRLLAQRTLPDDWPSHVEHIPIV